MNICSIGAQLSLFFSAKFVLRMLRNCYCRASGQNSGTVISISDPDLDFLNESTTMHLHRDM